MRRLLMFVPALGVIAAALGCHHIGGKCDCQSNPADAVWQGPTNPYPTAPVFGPAAKTPAKGTEKTPDPVPDKLPPKE